VLQGLSENELKALADAGRVGLAPAGTHLYEQGDPASLLFLVTQGKVIFYRVTPGGRRSQLDAVGPGGIVGSYSLASDIYFFTARALEQTTTVIWDSRTAVQLLEAHPKLATNSLRLAVGRIFELTQICSELVTDPVERRLASALLRLGEKLGERWCLSIRIVGLSEEEIASLAGTTLSTANRVLRKWERQGVVRTGRRRIVIHDPARLAQVAGRSRS
jgi:CRP-like cAMP-binding protein